MIKDLRKIENRSKKKEEKVKEIVLYHLQNIKFSNTFTFQIDIRTDK